MQGDNNGDRTACSDLVHMELQEIKEYVKTIQHDQENINLRLIYTLESLPDKATIDNLADKIAGALGAWNKAVPIRLVFLIFILVVGLVFGVETFRALLSHLHLF